MDDQQRPIDWPSDDRTEIAPWSSVLWEAGWELAPGWLRALRVIAEQTEARRHNKIAAFMMELEDRTHDNESVAAAIAQSPVLEAAFLSAFDSAMKTGLSAKRSALAKLVSEAVLGEGEFDLTSLLIAALQDLDAPHITALERLDRYASPEVDGFVGPGDSLSVLRWYQENIAPPIRCTLERNGCTELPSGVIASSYHMYPIITDFGRKLLGYIRGADCSA